MSALEKAKSLPRTVPIGLAQPDDIVGYVSCETILGTLFMAIDKKTLANIKRPVVIVVQ